MGEPARAVRREVVLPATRDRVWLALTSGRQLSAWFGGEVEIEPRAGGRVTCREGDSVRRALVEEAVPLTRLSFRWLTPVDTVGLPGRVPRTRVEFTLEEVSGGTRLTVVEAALWQEPFPSSRPPRDQVPFSPTAAAR